MYGDTLDRNCKLCDANCVTCKNGQAGTDCETCSSDKFLTAGTTKTC